MTFDRRLAGIAARQHALFTAQQYVDLGRSEASLRHGTRIGRYERVEPNVYRMAGAPATWHQSVLVACLAEDGLASHRTAAALWGLDGFSPRIVEVVTPRWSRRPNASVRVHESLDLAAEDRAERAHIPVTSVPRTLIDLGAVVPRNAVEQALDDALTRRLVTLDELHDRFVRLARRGRAGVGVLRPLLEQRLGTTGRRPGEFERRLLRLLLGAGLPEPAVEHEVRAPDGTFIARVDLAYPERRLALECDGEPWHVGRLRRQHDLGRQNKLVLSDWTILRFTWQDLADRPDVVLGQVRSALLAVPA